MSIYDPDIVEEPDVLPFPRLRIHQAHDTVTLASPVVDRARTVYQNRCCPTCGSVAVDPIELNDGIFNSQGRPITGSATVVAFHCNRCFHEWPSDR